jgi:hypothetical protein
VPERHQLKIARDTLRMSPAMAKVMGGMTIAKAREVFKSLMAKARGTKNPKRRRRNYWQEEIKAGSRSAVISANTESGPFSIRLYFDYGKSAGYQSKTAKTIAGARKIAKRMLAAHVGQNPPYKPGTVMSRFRRHKLRSSSGRLVRTKPMAKAILLSELRAAGRIPPRKNSRRRKKNDLDPRWKQTLAARQHSHERFIKKAIEIHYPGKKFADLSPFEQSAVLQFAHKLQREDAAGLKNPKRKKNSVTWGRMRKKPSKRIRTALRKIGRKRKRNYENALDLAVKFHGRRIGMDKDTGLPVADYGSHDELGQLGKVASLTIGDKEAEKPWCKRITWGGKEAPDLAAEPGGTQLYLVGGNQNIDRSLDKLPIDASKDMLDLGFAYQIEYFTRKEFDNFQPVTYYHDLGEETGESPRVVYDRVKRRIHLVGGAYKVKPEGVVN